MIGLLIAGNFISLNLKTILIYISFFLLIAVAFTALAITKTIDPLLIHWMPGVVTKIHTFNLNNSELK